MTQGKELLHYKNIIDITIKELHDNINFYQMYVDSNNMQLEIRQYFELKRYNTSFCDILPYVIANALNICIIIYNMITKDRLFNPYYRTSHKV